MEVSVVSCLVLLVQTMRSIMRASGNPEHLLESQHSAGFVRTQLLSDRTDGTEELVGFANPDPSALNLLSNEALQERRGYPPSGDELKANQKIV
jgi:hypothetical protein